MKKIFLIITIWITISFTTPANAFSITPSKMLLTMDPGNNKSISIEVYNTGNTDQYFAARILGVRQDNSGKPEFVRGINEAENWVKIKENNILIKSKQKNNINLEIVVPKDVRSGSYYLAIAIRPQTQTDNTSAIIGEVVSLLNIQVSGTAYENIVITKWAFDKTKSNKNNWVFDLNLANNGNMDADMTGSIIIKSWKGDELIRQNIKLGNKLLTNSVRFLNPKVDLSNNLIFPMVYQSSIEIKYGLLGQSTVATEYVFFLPLWSKVLGSIVVILIIVVCFALFKAKNERKKEMHSN